MDTGGVWAVEGEVLHSTCLVATQLMRKTRAMAPEVLGCCVPGLVLGPFAYVVLTVAASIGVLSA